MKLTISSSPLLQMLVNTGYFLTDFFSFYAFIRGGLSELKYDINLQLPVIKTALIKLTFY